MNYCKKVLKNWFYVDARTLALFRITFALIGLCDVLRRYGLIDVFYSNLGMDFRRYATSKYSIKYFSLLNHFDGSLEVRFFFLITALCFVFLLFGYRTRLFQILSAIGLISIHNAAVILENGADMVINNYLVWTMFLPLGSVWSVDSIRKSLKRQPEYDAAELNIKEQKKNTKIFHIAYVACLVQLSMIYFYNYINKTGNMWLDGTAVHYMYQLDTFVTMFGEWFASMVSLDILKVLTITTTYIEFWVPIFILSPLFQPWLRRIAFIVFVIFHLMIALSINIGLFSWVMIAVLTLLISSKDIDLAKCYLKTFIKRKYTVFYDRDCGFCHLTARILKRMDGYFCLTWSDSLHEGKKPKNLNSYLDKTIVVWDPETDEIWTRHKGFSRILSVLPLGFLISWVLLVPGLEKIFGFVYDIIAKNRPVISRLLGMPACGIKEERSMDSIKKESKYIIGLSKSIIIISNILALTLLLGAFDYSIRINDGLKEQLNENKFFNNNKSHSLRNIRKNMKRFLLYPRMYQEWNMFSPKVITYEKWLLADIIFENGDTLVLFQSDDRIEDKFQRNYFSNYRNQFWRKLFGRLGKKGYQRHIPKFKSWLKNTDYFIEYEGRKVRSVKLWKLSERSNDPNSNIKRKVTKRELKVTNKNSKRSKKRTKSNTKVRNKDILKKN